MTDDRALSRRALLATTAGATTLSLAGCSGESDTTPDTESNDTPNDTPEGNDTESGPGPDDSEDSPEVRVSATLRDPDGGALKAVRLGDRTTNGTTQQRVAVAVQTNQDSAQYTATVDDTTLSTGSGGVTDGAYTDTFDLTYGALLEAVGPGEFELTLSATAAGETASDAAPLSLAPPGITIDAPDSLALQEGGSVTLAPRFDTIVDTEYTPTVEYEVTVGGDTVQFTDETDLSYSQVAELVGEDLDPDGEVTAQVTAESAPRTQDVTLDLSLADIQASLDAPDTLGEHTEATLDIATPVNTAYTLKIGETEIQTGEYSPDTDQITVDLNYEQIVENTGAGQHTITLETQTHGTQNHDLGQIQISEPTFQQEYGDPERILQLLDVLPGDGTPQGTVNPDKLYLHDIGLMRELASDEALNEGPFGEDILALPKDLKDDRTEILRDNIETYAVSRGHQTETLHIHMYQGNVINQIIEQYLSQLDLEDTYEGVDIYRSIYSDNVDEDLYRFVLEEQNADVITTMEGAEGIIDAAHGETQNLRGELGFELEDGSVNEILSGPDYPITIAGETVYPQHLMYDVGGIDGTPEHDWKVMTYTGDGNQADDHIKQYLALLGEDGELVDEREVNTGTAINYQIDDFTGL